jgi:dihydropyrimidinase
MALLIKNGEIVTGDSRYIADIWCEGETITRIDHDIQAPARGAEVIDASGKYVFPGFIDPHTHIYLPFMGTFSKDDYKTGTKAAPPSGERPRSSTCAARHGRWNPAKGLQPGRHRRKEKRLATIHSTWE